MTVPPKRLFETESAALRDGLAAAKQKLPSSEQLAQLAERLASVGIVVPPEPPIQAAPVAGKSLGIGLKAAGLGAAGVGTAALVFLLGRSPDDAPKPPSVVRDAVSAVAPLAPTVPLTASAPRAPAPVSPPARTPALEDPPSDPAPSVKTRDSATQLRGEPRTLESRPPGSQTPPRAATGGQPARRDELPPPLEAPHTTSSRTEPPEPPPEAPPSSEVELLKRARSSVASDPAQALTLARRHAAEFPYGAFAQERDFIAISALVRLGRGAEAKALASAFRGRYPRSAYLPQLDRLLGKEP